MSGWGRLLPVAFVAGLCLVFVGERVLGEGADLRLTLGGTGVVLALGVVVGRAVELVRASGQARIAVVPVLSGYLAAVLGLGAYAMTLPWALEGLEADAAKSSKDVWRTLWLLLVGCGTLMALASEWSRAGLTRPELVEVRRVRGAAGAALTVGLALAWVFVLNYLADKKDERLEWSSLRRLEPSQGTQDVLASLREEVTVTAFFPPGNEVLDRVQSYLEKIQPLSSQLKVEVLDHALEPSRAAELGVRSNGQVVVSRGKEKERIQVGLDYEKPHLKQKLGELDKDFQKALLRVGRPRRELHLVTSHGERDERAADANLAERPGISLLKENLTLNNVQTKQLGARQGLGAKIAEAAEVVAIIGPTHRFLPEEIESLRKLVSSGGSLLLMLDPGAGHGLEELLKDFGLEMPKGTVAHLTQHLQTRGGGVADRGIVFSNRYGSHSAVSTLSSFTDAFVVFDGAGVVRRGAGASEAKTQPLVRPMADAFLDVDGNFEKGEAEGGLDNDALVMAVTVGQGDQEGRVIVVADSDMAADHRLARANLQLFVDAYRWLARDSDVELRVGEPKKDAPLVHTRDQDVAWFWSTVAVVPLAIFGMGLAVVRRRKGGGSK
jgi:hypothetical protein